MTKRRSEPSESELQSLARLLEPLGVQCSDAELAQLCGQLRELAQLLLDAHASALRARDRAESHDSGDLTRQGGDLGSVRPEDGETDVSMT
jgi:hypothetical protein